MESKPAPKTPLRIGDAERDRAIAELGDHFAAGRLSTEEFEQLFVDLPRTPEPSMESSSHQRSDAHLAWSPVLWFAPLLVVCAVVAAVLLSAPWLVWMILWMFLITGFFRRRRHHFGPPRRYYHY
jgi:hypothetical protein